MILFYFIIIQCASFFFHSFYKYVHYVETSITFEN